MKKYLILLIIPLLFFSTGCEEDAIQPTELNSELYGNWYDSNYIGGFVATLTLSSNGNFVLDTYYSHSGIWWVEGNYLVLSDQGEYGISSPYSVSGDELEFDGHTWVKQ